MARENFYYNLSGGINTAKTRIGLGQDTKKLYWWDSYNVEIYKNQGVARQLGNKLVLKITGDAKILGLYEYPKNTSCFVFATENGEIYYYNSENNTTTLIKTFTESISRISFVHFLDGLVIAPDASGAVYYNINSSIPLKNLNLEDSYGTTICSDVVSVFAGRVWVATSSTLYFSALGTCDDWTTAEDAGYIAKFHSSTSEILALQGYCGTLAVYKSDGVYLLSGSNPEDFTVIKFADKGALSSKSVVTADNKQFFAHHDGIFCLAQAGILSQISLSGNIAKNVQSFFEQINYTETLKTFALSYEIKNQIWFFLPFKDNDSLNKVLIYDYACDAWTKRVIPYQITSGATVCGKIYTASAEGEIFEENCGNNFASKAIPFCFSSPFFNLGLPTTRKIVEDFNFIFDEGRDNRFKLGISKDYVSCERTDVDYINTLKPKALVWLDDTMTDDFNSLWANESDYDFEWAEAVEESYKTEIFDANTAVQLHIEGSALGDDFAIVGLEFKEILIDE